MSVVVNISDEKFAKLETIPIFVMRTGCDCLDLNRNIRNSADKAALLRHFRSNGRGLFAKHQKRVASFVHISNYRLMRTGENLTADAQGVSVVTHAARKSATSKSKPTKASKSTHIYRVIMYARRYNLPVANLCISHDYEATSPDEAKGMALGYISAAFPTYSVDAHSINVYKR